MFVRREKRKIQLALITVMCNTDESKADKNAFEINYRLDRRKLHICPFVYSHLMEERCNFIFLVRF